MYSVLFTSVNKNIKKSLGIPTRRKGPLGLLSKPEIGLVEADQALLGMVNWLKEHDQKQTYISFEVISSKDDVIWPFENIKLSATDKGTEQPLIAMKVGEAVAEASPDVEEEDIALPGHLTEQLLAEENGQVNVDEEKPFNHLFSKTDDKDNAKLATSNQSLADIKTTEANVDSTEKTPDIDQVISTQQAAIDDPFADIDDEEEDITLPGTTAEVDLNKPTQQDDHVEQNDSNVDSLEDEAQLASVNQFDYASYVNAAVENNSLIDLNQSILSRSGFFEHFNLPEDVKSIEVSDQLALEKHDFLEQAWQKAHIESIERDYLTRVNKVKADLREQLGNYLKEHTDPKKVDDLINEKIAAEAETAMSQLNEDLNLYKEELLKSVEAQITAIQDKAESDKRAYNLEIDEEAKNAIDRLKSDFEKDKKLKFDELYQKYDTNQEQKRSELKAMFKEELHQQLTEYRTKQLTEVERKLANISADVANQYEKILTSVEANLNDQLPQLKANVNEKRSLELQEEAVKVQIEEKNQKIKLLEKELQAQNKKTSQNTAPVVVVPGNNESKSDNKDLVQLVEKLVADKQSQPVAVPEPVKKQGHKSVIALSVATGILALSSLGLGGYTVLNNQHNQERINQLNQQLINKTNATTYNAKDVKNTSKTNSLEALLAKKLYVDAYSKYQDEDSLNKIANTMLSNGDLTALKTFNKKFDSTAGQIDQAILEKDNARLKVLNNQLSDKQKDQLTGQQVRALSEAR